MDLLEQLEEKALTDSLVKIAEAAAATSCWMHSIGLAEPRAKGSKILQNLDNALNELDNILANHKTK
jgi:hypothetical protein